MGRHFCSLKQKLRKGLWSPEEDEKLFNYITMFGVGCWSSVPKLAGNNINIYTYISSYQHMKEKNSLSFLLYNSLINQNYFRVAKVWKEL
jgi:hypothetical protein